LLVAGSTQLPAHAISVPGHDTAHWRFWHASPGPHWLPGLPPVVPHPSVAPQCWLLVVGSIHAPLQLTSPPGQDTEHTPPLHTWPGAHATPPTHPAPTPHCWSLVAGSTHVPKQFTSLPGQDTEHAPPLHTWPGGQAAPAPPPFVPHPAVAPQYWLLVFGSTHVPLQLISLPGHDTEHLPPLQTWPDGQFVPAVPASTFPQPVVAPQ
jgi:hypothetical protein